MTSEYLLPLIFWYALTYGIITEAQLIEELPDLSCHEYKIRYDFLK